MRSAIWSGNVERAREVAARVAALAATGPLTEALRLQADAAVAALEGRRDDAVAGYCGRHRAPARAEQMFTAAVVSVDAIGPAAGGSRDPGAGQRSATVAGGAAAKPYLAKLDEALASVPAPVAGRSESRAETPTA